ncbi:MAG: helix-turn-helix domain containing protein [Candidatus Brocadia sp.]|jgi:transposase
MGRKKTFIDTTVLDKLQPKISEEVKKKLGWFEYYEKCGKNARLTCRHFGISPDTFYRWKKRYDPNNLLSLVDDKKTRRPKNVRQPTTPAWVVTRIKELKETYPAWSGGKLSVQLKNEGVLITASTVRRVITRLKKAGILREPVEKTNNNGKEIINRYGRTLPTGYHEYISLLQLWKK